jgi:hypothetical protein
MPFNAVALSDLMLLCKCSSSENIIYNIQSFRAHDVTPVLSSDLLTGGF